jgi:hypothetical protein
MVDSSPGLQSPLYNQLAELGGNTLEHQPNNLAVQTETSSRLASEFLAGQKGQAGGLGGLERAAGVLGGGLADGIVASAENSLNMNTVKTVVESAAFGAGMGALAKAGTVGKAIAATGGLIMGAYWVHSEIERGRPQATWRATTDAYNSDKNTAQDRQIVATNGGALAFETGLAFVAGGLGMKAGLEVKPNWQVDAIAGVKSAYGSAVDFLASDGRAHGAHVLRPGDLGMAFAGRDVITPLTEPGLPGFSEGTRKILSGDTRPIAQRVYGNQYGSDGLPAQFDYHPSGLKPIIPFDKAAEILDPAAFKPKSMSSFSDLAKVFNSGERAKLGASDPIARDLRQNISEGGAKGRALIDEGQRLQLLQDGQIKPHGDYYADELKGHARDVVAKEKVVTDIEAQAKAITALRLESARITLKLKRMGETSAGDAVEGAPQLKAHLEQQKTHLQAEIERRNEQVGSVRDSESPIARAREDLKQATAQAHDWFVFNDRTHIDAKVSWHDTQAYYEKQASDLVGTQRAIETNAEAQKDTAVRFSESVHAYQARLDALQNPAGTGRAAAKVTAERGEPAPVVPRPGPARPIERAPAVNEVKAPPIDAKAAATDLVRGSLRSDLRERAGARLSTQTLQQDGVLDLVANKVYDNSTVALFKDGKPVSVIGNDQRPHMALLDVRSYNQRMAQLSDISADGFAVLSPIVEADGSMAVLRQQPLSSGKGTRPIFKKEVIAVGGNVPGDVQEGTSFGKLFALFSRGQG